MKILQIRFKNLNSLVGEWDIDLTHPAFTSDGIFAITGPTGAGKTTILDAICLALYGRTPRLNKVTKSGNEIMSRQTGECFAEVVFETQAGRFRCHWSQHRARKKPSGELQPPKQEIADADSGLIFEAKLRGVAEQIELATGMDFERFTRSMLLAQGGFATFLQADADERAPILEQITGTEIYSHISIEVHKRRSEEKIKLDLLQAEFAGVSLLSDTQEQQLALDLEKKTRQELDLNQQVTHKNQAINWREGILRLEKESCLIELQHQDLVHRQALFNPERIKLQRANQALELAGEYAGLVSQRGEQEADQLHLADKIQALPKQTNLVQQADDAFNSAVQQLNRKKIEQKEMQAVIRTVREMDLKYVEKKTPFKSLEEHIKNMVSELQCMRLKHEADSAVLHLKKLDFNELMRRINETRVDEGLVEHLAGIRGHFDLFNQLNARHELAVIELTQMKAQSTQMSHAWSRQSTLLETLRQQYQHIQHELSQKQAMAVEDIALLRERFFKLTQRKEHLNKLVDLHALLAASKHSVTEHHLHHEVLTAEKQTLQQQLHLHHEQQLSLEREIQLLETQLSLLEKIQSFEVARQHLKEGESCPLCGAIEHPFAEGSMPLPDETSIRLNEERKNLKTTVHLLSDLKVKQAEVHKDLEQSALFKTQLTDKIVNTEGQIQQVLLELVDMLPDEIYPQRLHLLQQENTDQLTAISNTILITEKLDKEIAALRQAFDKTKDAVIESERENQAALHQKDIAFQAFESAQKAVNTLVTEIDDATKRLLHTIAPFGFQHLTLDVMIDLTERRNQFLLRQKKKSELEQDILSLEKDLQYQLTQMVTREKDLQQQEDSFVILERELNELAQCRMELYGDKNPDQDEERCLLAIDEAEKKLDEARQMNADALQELGKIKHRIEELDTLIKARFNRLNLAEESFQARLYQGGFADEAGYLASCLSEDERKMRLKKAVALDAEQTELEVKRRDTQALLDLERQKNLTHQSIEELQCELLSLVQLHRNVQHEIGGIYQTLKDNDNLRLRQQDRSKVIDKQKKECSRWTILHELIGSVDGKKYRNFAQGLTFEMMIGHANRQLLKMTDRYLLSRDESQPLELNVIDSYQAGEIRSTKNLSGGEGFIISLCLALGLSQMSSHNVRVDSLFLDEGFGTLDDDALDTALETLASLQQDGKLIGMISHVPALKERISTQIHVIPQAGGRSIISGFGCRLMENCQS